METKIVKLSLKNGLSQGIDNQLLMRSSKIEDWLSNDSLNLRLSGTLRKNALLGFKYKSQLYQEALCQTLGWGFEMEYSSYITTGVPITEGDEKSLTELGWFVDRLLFIKIFDEDVYELRYINVQDEEGVIIKQGIGIIVKETSVQWIPKNHIVFSIVSEFDMYTKKWKEALNPF